VTGTELSTWSDSFMFTAEPSDAAAGPTAILLSGPTDPLGQIVAAAAMYKGRVVRDLADVTDEDRREMLVEIQKTVLKMPLETVQLHFMIEGVTRGFTHQMVRQRTAAYAQESTRFAVKEDMRTATALPPSLMDTVSLEEAIRDDIVERKRLGLGDVGELAKTDEERRKAVYAHAVQVRHRINEKGGAQAQRLVWDEAVRTVGDAYMELVNSGMPAEDARGLMPTNITTRLNYITNLRGWYDTMAVRVSDQAQFEWRNAAMAMAQALISFGAETEYKVKVDGEGLKALKNQPHFAEILETIHGPGSERHFVVAMSSEWQYEAIAKELKPIEFKMGGTAFGANFDRPSRIGERVAAFQAKGVPSSEWTEGSPEHGIPAINPEEWLFDPNSARLDEGEEFDIFGNRVPKGTGWHWRREDGLLVAASEEYEWLYARLDRDGGPQTSPAEVFAQAKLERVRS
jgi:flavin-dependent thymidylate synthase